MQFGIFTVGDVATDPTTGRTPTEHERIKAMVAIAQKAEEVGLDALATGEHHNRPFVPSSPTTSRPPSCSPASSRRSRTIRDPGCCWLAPTTTQRNCGDISRFLAA